MTKADKEWWLSASAKQRRRKARYDKRLRMNRKPTPKAEKIPLAIWARIA